MKNISYVLCLISLSSFVSVFAHAGANKDNGSNMLRKLNKTCVLHRSENRIYTCKTDEVHIGGSTLDLDFTTLVNEQHYPVSINCKWLGRGYVKNHHNVGGGYTVTKRTGNAFTLYRNSKEGNSNIIGVSFGGQEINGVSVSCSADQNRHN